MRFQYTSKKPTDRKTKNVAKYTYETVHGGGGGGQGECENDRSAEKIRTDKCRADDTQP